jgi:hypothetical protein
MDVVSVLGYIDAHDVDAGRTGIRWRTRAGRERCWCGSVRGRVRSQDGPGGAARVTAAAIAVAGVTPWPAAAPGVVDGSRAAVLRRYVQAALSDHDDAAAAAWAAAQTESQAQNPLAMWRSDPALPVRAVRAGRTTWFPAGINDVQPSRHLGHIPTAKPTPHTIHPRGTGLMRRSPWVKFTGR